jgi:hypothetical protein
MRSGRREEVLVTIVLTYENMFTQATFVCFGAGRSTVLRHSSGRRSVAGTCRRTATSTSVSASPGLTIDFFQCDSSERRPNPRLLRGRTFNNQPSNVRSAYRNRNAPAYRNTNNRFRPSSTWQQDVNPVPPEFESFASLGACSQVQVVVPCRATSVVRTNETPSPAGLVGLRTRTPSRAHPIEDRPVRTNSAVAMLPVARQTGGPIPGEDPTWHRLPAGDTGRERDAGADWPLE